MDGNGSPIGMTREIHCSTQQSVHRSVLARWPSWATGEKLHQFLFSRAAAQENCFVCTATPSPSHRAHHPSYKDHAYGTPSLQREPFVTSSSTGGHTTQKNPPSRLPSG